MLAHAINHVMALQRGRAWIELVDLLELHQRRAQRKEGEGAHHNLAQAHRAGSERDSSDRNQTAGAHPKVT